ncbi:methylaspartate mutase [Streptomyces sp. 5-6(2022)]|uniref:methylaspartate mutase n=1 Tax=Streptomyces sp. 5-6(2022) TaxID=2936510 RepID=UPI0023B9D0D4|nr:methylaspartate mutase [Streptomyces sp. 5-6(2022)]
MSDVAPRTVSTDVHPSEVDFGAFVRRAADAGELVAQPRMGFGPPGLMRAGLAATRAAAATTVGTLTLDSYTRVGDLASAERAVRADGGANLNGYPIVSHPAETTAAVLAGLLNRDFPVQVRHGSAVPTDIFSALIALRLTATEGGPVSYCLPYGRTPLAESIRNWSDCAVRFAALREFPSEPHLETFGGCMLGQLCPPGLLVALSVLEALFFQQRGLRSLSVSYAQQTNPEQDIEAVLALRRLCQELLSLSSWHVVIYAYMGVYPRTDRGAYRLLGEAAGLALATGSERIIVKTVAESRRIPTIAENVAALEYVARAAGARPPLRPPADGANGGDSATYQEANALINAVRNLHRDIGTALLLAFRRGYLDVPYCVHPDNRGRTRSALDGAGRLCWADTGALPVPPPERRAPAGAVTSSGLLEDLFYIQRKYDACAPESGETAASPALAERSRRLPGPR